jgi:hypothetical protein
VGTDESTYISTILPELLKPTAEIRVSKFGIDDERDSHTTVNSDNLKVTAPDIGYYYINSGWGNRASNLQSNSDEFIEKVIGFLFPRGRDEDPKAQGSFLVHVPGYGDYNLNLSSEVPVDMRLQEAFSKISGVEVPTPYTTHPQKVVFIYKSNNIINKEPVFEFVRPAGNVSLGYKPPLRYSVFLHAARSIFYPIHGNPHEWKILLMVGEAAWNEGGKSGIIDSSGAWTFCEFQNIIKDGVEVRQLNRTNPIEISEKQWDQMKRKQFKQDEPIRVVRCFVGCSVQQVYTS